MTNNKPAPILKGEEAKKHLDLISRCYVNQKTATPEQQAAFAMGARGYYKSSSSTPRKEVWCVFDNSTGNLWVEDFAGEAGAVSWLENEVI